MGAGGADRVVRAGAGRACARPFLRGAHRAAGGGQPCGHVHDDFHRADRRAGLLPEAAQAFGRFPPTTSPWCSRWRCGSFR